MLAAAAVLGAACGGPVAETPTTMAATPPLASGETVRVLLVGDVMTGRGVAAAIGTDPDAVFADVRHLLNAADVAAANLESPLTALPHVSANENMLEADPATAVDLAKAGFDLMSLPNNHSTDAGPEGLIDTIAAVAGAGMLTVGGGPDAAAAVEPAVVPVGGLTVGFLAFDATGVGLVAADEPGVATWDDIESTAAIQELRSRVDVLVVSIHGGTEYLRVTDPGMADLATTLGNLGVDVVWGHGAHVVQPVQLLDGSRRTVAATSLGNFLFDQSGPDRTTGAMLEVLADANGVVAYRVGLAEHADRRVRFVQWLPPQGDAGWLHGSWWTLAKAPVLAPDTTTPIADFRHGDLGAAARGDITGDGAQDLVVSFRRPHQTTPFMELHPEVQWADASGRSAHLGVYDPDGLREIWVAGTVLMPIADLAVCDGAIATAHNQLDDPDIIAGGAWEWNGFGFDTGPDIDGTGTPGCADVDGDGATEPVIVNR
jgi:poly-gamma-glutamate synthesis protein (capsule biosynthesis protein)